MEWISILKTDAAASADLKVSCFRGGRSKRFSLGITLSRALMDHLPLSHGQKVHVDRCADPENADVYRLHAGDGITKGHWLVGKLGNQEGGRVIIPAPDGYEESFEACEVALKRGDTGAGLCFFRVPDAEGAGGMAAIDFGAHRPSDVEGDGTGEALPPVKDAAPRDAGIRFDLPKKVLDRLPPARRAFFNELSDGQPCAAWILAGCVEGDTMEVELVQTIVSMLNKDLALHDLVVVPANGAGRQVKHTNFKMVVLSEDRQADLNEDKAAHDGDAQTKTPPPAVPRADIRIQGNFVLNAGQFKAMKPLVKAFWQAMKSGGIVSIDYLKTLAPVMKPPEAFQGEHSTLKVVHTMATLREAVALCDLQIIKNGEAYQIRAIEEGAA